MTPAPYTSIFTDASRHASALYYTGPHSEPRRAQCLLLARNGRADRPPSCPFFCRARSMVDEAVHDPYATCTVHFFDRLEE